MIKLLAVDMDGTCLNRKSLMTEETKKALEAAVKSGITVVPTTGRCLFCLPHQLAGRKDIYRYVISSNGARVTDCELDKSLLCSDIPKETALSFLEECAGSGAGIASHMEHVYLIQGRMLALMGRAFYGKDARGVEPVKNMASYIRSRNKGVEEIQLYFLAPGTRIRLEKILGNFPQLSFASTKIYMEIFSRNTSKGTALTALSGHLGIQKSEIACIGDGENDLSMFEASGLKFAMGNGVKKLKEKADYVLPSNEENGVAAAIKNYILGGC